MFLFSAPMFVPICYCVLSSRRFPHVAELICDILLVHNSCRCCERQFCHFAITIATCESKKSPDWNPYRYSFGYRVVIKNDFCLLRAWVVKYWSFPLQLGCGWSAQLSIAIRCFPVCPKQINYTKLLDRSFVPIPVALNCYLVMHNYNERRIPHDYLVVIVSLNDNILPPPKLFPWGIVFHLQTTVEIQRRQTMNERLNFTWACMREKRCCRLFEMLS